MEQKTLMVTPVALFANVGGRTEERGNCACAIVGTSGSNPPRFNLVCYNEQRVPLCSASITSSNEQSLQFQMQTAEYATFCDNTGSSWSIMFLRSADIDQFCANLGVACFGAAGKPSHTHAVCDLSHVTQRNPGKLVRLGDRCKCRFAAFDLQRGEAANDVPVLTRLLGTNGDIPYNFLSVQSAYSILPDGKGFENSVVGMAEDSKRVVVLPASVPRSCPNPYGAASIVFVIHVTRILHEDLPVVREVPPAEQAKAENGALVPVQLELANVPQSAGGSPASAKPKPGTAMDPLYSGVGVPAEHMSQVQKIAAAINSVTTQLRDLEDKILAFQEDWKQTTTRPKPSTLTPAALEQQVKHLIMEHERVRDEITRRDELIRSIDERNRDLQKRMDKAAMIAQNLLDEKQATVSSTSDLRLEQDRQIMKLQEQITRASTERDDIHRHLSSVKKMLEMSDSELRDAKGKHEVLQVQLQAMANKLDASEDSLAEERSRRKALEAKSAALNEEIRQLAADLHLKGAQSQDLSRKMESDRLHHIQVMEDDRQRRAMETQQLRSEIVNELQLREEKFQADRARVAEDFYSRGRDEGKEIGKKNAAIDVEARVQELQLDAQRARTELDAYKTQVRSAQEEAMNENRRLEAIVSTNKNATDAETRRKAQTEFKLQSLRTKVRNAEDVLFVQFTNCIHRLRRPVAPDDLLRLLQSVKESTNPDFSFQTARHEAEASAAFQKRFEWITEEVESQYRSRQSSLFHQTFLPAVTAAYEHTKSIVHQLWLERDQSVCGSLVIAECSARFSIDAEWEMDFNEIADFYRAIKAEQNEVLEAEVAGRVRIEHEFASTQQQVDAFFEEQRAQRGRWEEEETQGRHDVVAEEHAGWHHHVSELEAALFAKIIAEQQEICADEATARQSLVAEQAEELVALEGEESAQRDDAGERTRQRLAAEAERAASEQEEAAARAATQEEEASELDVVLNEEHSARQSIYNVELEAAKAARKAREVVVDASNPLGEGAVVVAADSESDSEGERRLSMRSTRNSAPPKNSTRTSAAKLPVASGKLFGSDSEGEAEKKEKPVAAPPPPRKPAAPKKGAAKLFDSDDD